MVAGASVVGEVLEQFKDKKVIAFKYRRRKGYHRNGGSPAPAYQGQEFETIDQ